MMLRVFPKTEQFLLTAHFLKYKVFWKNILILSIANNFYLNYLNPISTVILTAPTPLVSLPASPLFALDAFSDSRGRWPACRFGVGNDFRTLFESVSCYTTEFSTFWHLNLLSEEETAKTTLKVSREVFVCFMFQRYWMGWLFCVSTVVASLRACIFYVFVLG